MPRKVNHSATADLMRPTQANEEIVAEPMAPQQVPTTRRSPKPSGRVRHDEKITVYVSSAELLALEHARLALRADHGIAVDRGRVVREALASMLEDLEENRDSSQLVARLKQR